MRYLTLETLDVNTNISHSTAEAILSEGSVPLSLLADVNELVANDLDVAVESDDVIEEKDDSKQSTTILNICG